MRTAPLIGKKAWFGPRRLGWGLEPVSLEGWAVTVAGVVASRWVVKRTGRRVFGHLTGLAVVMMALLKGTSPGGRKARRAFTAARRAAS
ncbi:MAG: hypothetical protein J2O39_08145, partial [Acidimicrobiales bacterium]|nr:hypothetical protein [Acidimicrobiales bacterium]